MDATSRMCKQHLNTEKEGSGLIGGKEQRRQVVAFRELIPSPWQCDDGHATLAQRGHIAVDCSLTHLKRLRQIHCPQTSFALNEQQDGKESVNTIHTDECRGEDVECWKTMGLSWRTSPLRVSIAASQSCRFGARCARARQPRLRVSQRCDLGLYAQVIRPLLDSTEGMGSIPQGGSMTGQGNHQLYCLASSRLSRAFADQGRQAFQ
jgi:hypothetical protein